MEIRPIDANALQIEIDSLSRLAQTNAQKLLLGRVFYIIDHMPAIPAYQWINVNDRLPIKCRLVHITDGNNIKEGYIKHYGIWILKNGMRSDKAMRTITHWMPLLKPPEK